VIILIYHLYFSDLKWIRYELSKFPLFSGIFEITDILFYTELTLAAGTDAWGLATSDALLAVDPGQIFDWEEETSPATRRNAGERWRRPDMAPGDASGLRINSKHQGAPNELLQGP
jgi:hypothetical protein